MSGHDYISDTVYCEFNSDAIGADLQKFIGKTIKRIEAWESTFVIVFDDDTQIQLRGWMFGDSPLEVTTVLGRKVLTALCPDCNTPMKMISGAEIEFDFRCESCRGIPYRINIMSDLSKPLMTADGKAIRAFYEERRK